MEAGNLSVVARAFAAQATCRSPGLDFWWLPAFQFSLLQVCLAGFFPRCVCLFVCESCCYGDVYYQLCCLSFYL